MGDRLAPSRDKFVDRRGLSPAAFLLTAMALSWLDRSLPNVFLEAIRQEIHLSDTQLGLLTGTAFALCYALGVLPAGWMADRWHRPRLLAAGMTIWSLLTMAVALAHNFVELFVCRMGVGLGEAVLLPTAYSLLTDLYVADRRTRAVAIMALGVPIGSGLALLGGAHLAAWFQGVGLAEATSVAPWRLVFAAVGAIGLLVAAAAALLPEPRQRLVSRAETRREGDRQPFGRYLLRSRSRILPMVAGATTFNMAAAGFLGWMVALLVRIHGQTTSTAGGRLGFATIATGLAAAPLAAMAAPRLNLIGIRDGARVLLAVCSLLAGVAAVAASLLADPNSSFAAAVISLFAIFTATAILPVVIIEAVDPAFVARATAILIFCASAIGTASGPLLIGVLSDRVFGGDLGLRWAMALGTGILLATAASCFAMMGPSAQSDAKP